MYPDDPSNDDRVVSEKVRNIMKEKGSVYLLRGDYSCRDLKSVIGKCDVLIGARTHATIASSSQLVPTLALAYSTKAFGIMEDVYDKNNCTCEVKNITQNELLEKICYLIDNRHEISKIMSENLNEIRIRSRLNGEFAKKIFNH